MDFGWIDKYEAFLFDFDGLLVDTEALHHKAYQLLCKERGYPLPWSFNQYCKIAYAGSTNIRDGIYALFPKLLEQYPHWEVLYARKKQLYMDLLANGELKLMAGVEEFLQALKSAGKKRIVATNSTLLAVLKIKESLKTLDLIPLWITREDYKDPKPAPDAYLAALRALNVEAGKAIGFEDSFRGVMALKKAGVKPVMVVHKEMVPHGHPDLSDVAYFESMRVMHLS